MLTSSVLYSTCFRLSLRGILMFFSFFLFFLVCSSTSWSVHVGFLCSSFYLFQSLNVEFLCPVSFFLSVFRLHLLLGLFRFGSSVHHATCFSLSSKNFCVHFLSVSRLHLLLGLSMLTSVFGAFKRISRLDLLFSIGLRESLGFGILRVFFRHDLVLSSCLVLLTGVMHKLLTPFSSFAQFSGIITVSLDDYEKLLTLSYIIFSLSCLNMSSLQQLKYCIYN